MFLVNVRKCLKIFDKVYVSSDGQTILDLAKTAGAIPILRGEELCGDTPDIPVFQHALQHMEKGVTHIVAVHANNPTINPELISLTKKFLEAGAEEVMTCHPIERGEKYKDQSSKINGSIRGMSAKRLQSYPDPYRPRPEVWLVDDSLEIETQEDYETCLESLK